jgi:hypothetical protein
MVAKGEGDKREGGDTRVTKGDAGVNFRSDPFMEPFSFGESQMYMEILFSLPSSGNSPPLRGEVD